jgi:hypothetical protein
LSVIKDKRSPFYRYKFQIDGRPFYGPTKKTNKREAEAVERDARKEAEREMALARAAATSLALDARPAAIGSRSVSIMPVRGTPNGRSAICSTSLARIR